MARKRKIEVPSDVSAEMLSLAEMLNDLPITEVTFADGSTTDLVVGGAETLNEVIKALPVIEQDGLTVNGYDVTVGDKGTTSRKIRELHSLGTPVKAIAKELGIRYQHAWNVVNANR
jgi:hypothetical protein